MNNLMILPKPLNNLNMLTSTNNSTSKLFTRKGSSFLNNKQVNRNLCYNWPFTPPPQGTFHLLDKAICAASLFLDSQPAVLHLTPDNQQPKYVPCFIFISITYLAPTQPRATH